MSQYLEKEALDQIVPTFDFDASDLISADTYNESKLLERIRTYTKEEKILLCKSAIQIAVIGSGGRQFGQVRHKGDVVEIIDIFNKLNIKYKNSLSEKLAEDDLTPRRLVRLFRFQIKSFIEKTNRPSYLWLKYANKSEKNSYTYCFPGAEHLITDLKEAEFLIETYANVDKVIETKFVERINRTFIARGIFSATLYRMKL
jgi:hypothetical protein